MKWSRLAVAAAAAAVSAAMLSACGDDPVKTVKDGTLEEFSKTVKVGQALDGYGGCEDKTKKWSTAGEGAAKTVRFTCTLKGTEDFYAPYRGDLALAQAGLALMQSLSEAFGPLFGDGGEAADADAEMRFIAAAAQVTRNDITVDFSIDSSDPKRFTLSSFKTEFYWGKDHASAENDPKTLSVVYANEPYLDAVVQDRRGFLDVLLKLYGSARSSKGRGDAPAVQMPTPGAAGQGSAPASGKSAASDDEPGPSAYAKF